jgi:hypothetical protein
VIRYEGLEEAVENAYGYFSINASGMGKSVALVTDGRFSAPHPDPVLGTFQGHEGWTNRCRKWKYYLIDIPNKLI